MVRCSTTLDTTAIKISAPCMAFFQNSLLPVRRSMVSALLITPMVIAPSSTPQILPDPPVTDTPPITQAAITYIS